MALLDRLSAWWHLLARPRPPARISDTHERDSHDRDPDEPATDSHDRDPDEPAADSHERDPDEPVVMPIEESIDLHHFAPRDIPSVVVEYLHEARKAGFREVRVIHGRGKGIQRRRVQLVLADHPAVESSRSDGLGSTLVRLRPPPRAR